MTHRTKTNSHTPRGTTSGTHPRSKPAHHGPSHAPVVPHAKSHVPHAKPAVHAEPAVTAHDTGPDAATFAALHLARPLLEALASEGYSTPTPIQSRAIPPIIQGRDVLGCAQTGTGKTAAFALPILHRLFQAPRDAARRGRTLPRALILSPTRELATQIAESFEAYGAQTGLTGAVIYGGVSQHHQVRALQRGVDVLVATPGRLIDLMEQGHTDFSAMEIFVLDEADRMLDMGFITPIRRIAAALPKPRQTLLFSATMPREIKHLADSLLHDPVRVAVAPVASTAALIEQKVYMVNRRQKASLLERLLTEGNIGRALVFTRTKHGADKVAKWLTNRGIASNAIHGNKAQNQRQRALDGFRHGRFRVLVATDVAARGIDVDAISHVFNFNLPNEPEAYVHRIGRTGRAGATGTAISFCDEDERGFLRDIEKLTARRLDVTPTPSLPEPVREPHSRADDHAHEAAHPDGGHAPRGPSRGRPHRGHASDYTDTPRRGHAERRSAPGGHAPSHTKSTRRPGGFGAMGKGGGRRGR